MHEAFLVITFGEGREDAVGVHGAMLTPARDIGRARFAW